MIIEMFVISCFMMAIGGSAIATANVGHEPKKTEQLIFTPPSGGSAVKKKPVKYSEKDLLVALVIDEIRKNPNQWKSEEVHKNQWRGSYYETLADRTNKIVVRRNHCWHIGSDHKDDCWINEVRITGKDFLEIKEVFDQKNLRDEVERLSQRRISRELQNETVNNTTPLLSYEGSSLDEIELYTRQALQPIYNRRT
jgi:hypothetical protein